LDILLNPIAPQTIPAIPNSPREIIPMIIATIA
jgi:hypothetical protein